MEQALNKRNKTQGKEATKRTKIAQDRLLDKGKIDEDLKAKERDRVSQELQEKMKRERAHLMEQAILRKETTTQQEQEERTQVYTQQLLDKEKVQTIIADNIQQNMYKHREQLEQQASDVKLTIASEEVADRLEIIKQETVEKDRAKALRIQNIKKALDQEKRNKAEQAEQNRNNRLLTTPLETLDKVDKEYLSSLIKPESLPKLINLLDQRKELASLKFDADNTLLHEAIRNVTNDNASTIIPFIGILISQYGAKCHETNNKGISPLFMAINRKSLDAVKALLENGAISKAEDPRALLESAKKLAKERNYTDIEKLFTDDLLPKPALNTPQISSTLDAKKSKMIDEELVKQTKALESEMAMELKQLQGAFKTHTEKLKQIEKTKLKLESEVTETTKKLFEKEQTKFAELTKEFNIVKREITAKIEKEATAKTKQLEKIQNEQEVKRVDLMKKEQAKLKELADLLETQTKALREKELQKKKAKNAQDPFTSIIRTSYSVTPKFTQLTTVQPSSEDSYVQHMQGLKKGLEGLEPTISRTSSELELEGLGASINGLSSNDSDLSTPTRTSSSPTSSATSMDPEWQLLEMLAANDVEGIKSFFKKHPNIIIKYRDDTDGNSLLHLAAKFGYLEMTKMLLEEKIFTQPNLPNKKGATPLHLAAEYKRADVVTALIEAKADVNAKTKNNNTPVYVAALVAKDPEIVKILLAHGADPALKYTPPAQKSSIVGLIATKKTIPDLLLTKINTDLANKQALTDIKQQFAKAMQKLPTKTPPISSKQRGKT